MKMKKRIQITESDRQSILRLHEKYKNSLLSEQSTNTEMGDNSSDDLEAALEVDNSQKNTQTSPPSTDNNTTSERWKTATCIDLKKSTRCKDKVLQVQMKINDKCSTNQLTAKLVEDGIWGPNTSSAFTACGGTISTQGGPTTTTTTTIASGGGSTTTTTTGQGNNNTGYEEVNSESV
jgi:hypothetical protein